MGITSLTFIRKIRKCVCTSLYPFSLNTLSIFARFVNKFHNSFPEPRHTYPSLSIIGGNFAKSFEYYIWSPSKRNSWIIKESLTKLTLFCVDNLIRIYLACLCDTHVHVFLAKQWAPTKPNLKIFPLTNPFNKCNQNWHPIFGMQVCP